MFREYDEEGDIKAGTFWREQKSVGANVATQIQLWVRENPLDLLEGIDWKTEFDSFSEGRLAGQIRDIAFKCANVIAVSEEVKFTGPVDRELKVEFSIQTPYGKEKLGVTFNADNN